MIPTDEQLAAVLPRCSAGLDGGDWTDDDERLAWERRVLPYVEEAARRQPTAIVSVPTELSDEDCARIKREWIWRFGKYEPWPAPAKGTHESNLGYQWQQRGAYLVNGDSDEYYGRGGWKENCDAYEWSRTHEEAAK